MGSYQPEYHSMDMIFNLDTIAEYGGSLCGEDRFSIEACEHCQGHYLFNHELKHLYYEADDLSRRFFKVEGMSLPPCYYCSAIEWDFSSISPNQSSIRKGPWAWSLLERQLTVVSDTSLKKDKS